MMRYGLDGSGGISFESVAMPGYYITQSKFRAIVAKVVNSASWKKDATWQFVKGQVVEHTVTHNIYQTQVTNGKYHFGSLLKVKSLNIL